MFSQARTYTGDDQINVSAITTTRLLAFLVKLEAHEYSTKIRMVYNTKHAYSTAMHTQSTPVPGRTAR